MNNLPADETVYFADAVHPEHQTKPAFGWVRKGSNPAVKTTTGRGRVNVHGTVKKWLARAECRIRLIKLPAYCPHLNPIERLWAVMHAHVTHNSFYATQKKFAEAILHFLRKTIPEEWRKSRDQVTDNFRIISHQNFRLL
ncbi:MAG: transposase [Emcibacter sp.]|nr:transposase [Emcibacter sp.]